MALFSGQTPLGMSDTNAMKQLRGPKHENWPVCDPHAAPPGEYGLKSGENGNPALARANGAIDGPYCSPTWPSVFGKRCEPLAGRGGGFGGGAAPAPTRAGAWGASSIRVPYGWMPHNASFGFLDLAPSILHSNWFWDYIS
jgi:hypothetical protein